MALSARAVLRALAYTPFVLVEALFFFAWLTLLDIHLRYTWRHLHAPWTSLLSALLATALVAAAAGCFALAVLRPPGYPDKDIEGGAERRRPVESEHDADDQGLEEGDNAPLLPTREPETDGERALDVALTLFPGAPQFPARSGRRQLGDVLNAADAHLADEARGRRRLHLADVQVKSSGERRWCNKCAAPKPDRAHHCSSCKRCVLRVSSGSDAVLACTSVADASLADGREHAAECARCETAADLALA
jgi:palmitoyltransferase